MFDGLGAERGKQWLVHRPETPGGEDGDQQLGSTRHQSGDPVAGAYAMLPEHRGEPRSLVLELIEAVSCAVAITVFPDQRQLAGTGVAVAAFDTGIEGFKATLQRRRNSLVMVKRTSGLSVVAHRRTPGLLFLLTIGSTIFALPGRGDNGQSCQSG
ncbi:hypothetical protein D3C76_592120 [compost metagenome]